MEICVALGMTALALALTGLAVQAGEWMKAHTGLVRERARQLKLDNDVRERAASGAAPAAGGAP